MIYNELKEICRINKISLQLVASEVGITQDGLKRGIDKQSLAIRYVVPLCQSLCITPNQFFGEAEPIKRNIQQNQTGGVGNTQTMNVGLSALQHQLVEKDRQLAEKDRQIARLLDLLNKK